jgi:hypothetical protein
LHRAPNALRNSILDGHLGAASFLSKAITLHTRSAKARYPANRVYREGLAAVGAEGLSGAFEGHAGVSVASLFL